METDEGETPHLSFDQLSQAIAATEKSLRKVVAGTVAETFTAPLPAAWAEEVRRIVREELESLTRQAMRQEGRSLR